MAKQNVKYFVGIDISKFKLDVAVACGSGIMDHLVINNDSACIQSWLDDLKIRLKYTRRNIVFCLEHTGKYGRLLVEQFIKRGLLFAMENPVHIKRSLGLVRDKSDKVDAARIALYAKRAHSELKLWLPSRPVIDFLAELSSARASLITISKVLNIPLADRYFLQPKLQNIRLRHHKKSMQGVSADLKSVEAAIRKVIKQDVQLNALNKLLLSVPGIGQTTALQFIITTNEFRKIQCPKKFASYAGVAPFRRESGTSRPRARVSHFANKKMKALLHMAALSAIRYDAEIRAYYLRKTEEQMKPKMLVINAVRNKLIYRVFACVKHSRLYQKLPGTLVPVPGVIHTTLGLNTCAGI